VNLINLEKTMVWKKIGGDVKSGVYIPASPP